MSSTIGPRYRDAENLFGSPWKTRARLRGDVARRPRGMAAMSRFLESRSVKRPPFAPPFLKAGRLVIAHTANILFFLGARLGLAPKDDASRSSGESIAAHHRRLGRRGARYASSGRKQLVLRRAEARSERASGEFQSGERLPKFLNYFERVLERNGRRVLAGNVVSYPDLSLFQMIEGLRYAFPRAMKKQERKYRRVTALHDPSGGAAPGWPHTLCPIGVCRLIRKGSFATILSWMIRPDARGGYEQINCRENTEKTVSSHIE